MQKKQLHDMLLSMHWRIQKVPAFLLSILLTAGVGFLIGRNFNTWDECNDYRFINPDFDCERKFVISKAAYTSLQNDLEDFIKEKRTSGEAEEISVFFRDLQSGPTIGIRKDKDFIPASLLKLPLVIVYFAIAEENPDILDTKLVYSWEELKFFKPIKQNVVPNHGLKRERERERERERGRRIG